MSAHSQTTTDTESTENATEPQTRADPRSLFVRPSDDATRVKIQGCPAEHHGCGRRAVPYKNDAAERVPRCLACGRPCMFDRDPSVNADGTVAGSSDHTESDS